MGHDNPITKAWHEFVMADPENCDQEWAAYLALVKVRETSSASSPTNSSSPLHHRTPAAAVTAPTTTSSTASLRVLSSAVPTDEFRSKPNTTVDDLSPGARRFYDFLVGGSSSPTTEPAAATATLERDLHSVTPSTCSIVCVGGDTSATSTLSSQVASSAFTPSSPMSVSAALVSPAVGVLLESGDHITLAPPTICFILRPSATIDTVASEVCSICLVPAPGASALPAAFLVDNVDTAKHTENRLQPWPTPRYATSQEDNMCKDMPQVLLWYWFVFESRQLMLWAAKNPWPPPFPNIGTVFCFVSCSILNLHSTLDNLQLSRDGQVLKTMTLGYSVVLLVINSVPRVQSIQLQPTLFKWPVSFCYDTHLPIPSTSVASLLDLLFTRRPTCIFWT